MWELIRSSVHVYGRTVMREVPPRTAPPPRAGTPIIAAQHKGPPLPPSGDARRVLQREAGEPSPQMGGVFVAQRVRAKLLLLQGHMRMRKGDYREALDLFDAAHALDPQNADVLRARAIAKEGLGRLQEAVADFTAALRADSKDSAALHQRGKLHCMLGQHARCIDDLERAVRHGESRDASYHSPAGVAHIKLGHFARARYHIKKALALVDDPSSRSNLKVLHGVPELSLAVQGRVRPASRTLYDMYTGLGATWYLAPIARALSLGATLSAGYGAHPQAHMFELAAGPVLINEFKNGKFGMGIEAGYAFLLGGDSRAALHGNASIVRYGVHYDHRVWRRLWMGFGVQAQHNGDNPKKYSLGAGVRLMVNLW